MREFQILYWSNKYFVYKIPEIANVQVVGRANKNIETKWERAWKM